MSNLPRQWRWTTWRISLVRRYATTPRLDQRRPGRSSKPIGVERIVASALERGTQECDAHLRRCPTASNEAPLAINGLNVASRDATRPRQFAPRDLEEGVPRGEPGTGRRSVESRVRRMRTSHIATYRVQHDALQSLQCQSRQRESLEREAHRARISSSHFSTAPTWRTPIWRTLCSRTRR